MQPKKKWTKPTLQRLDVPEQFDPSAGLTYEQWAALRQLEREAEGQPIRKAAKR